MNKLSTFLKIAAIPLVLALAPACALTKHTRTKLLDKLDATHAGKQEDGSYIKCIINGPHTVAAAIAKQGFKERSDKYDKSKRVHVEAVTDSEAEATCARGFHEEMGAKTFLPHPEEVMEPSEPIAGSGN